MPNDDTRKPYDEVTDDSYGQQAAQTFATSPTPGGLILSGHCPRCTDPMAFPYVDGVYRGLGPRRVRPPRDSDKLPMICTCVEDHAGRPAGSTGCGAYWNITVSTT